MSNAPAQAVTPGSVDNAEKSMDEIMSLCKRRGFIYPASEIYGGINGFWDYGPLGAQLKKNLRDAWWQDIIMLGCNGAEVNGEPVTVLPLDTCIIQNPKVWEASGHVAGFNDPMVDDKETKDRFRADHLFGLHIEIVRREPGYGVATAYRDLEKRLSDGSTHIPIFTCVAGTWAEALERFHLSLPKFDRRVKSVDVLQYPEEAVEVEILAKGKDGDLFVGKVEPLALALLDQHAERVPSPASQKAGSLTTPRPFNLMFPTVVGATGHWDTDKAYLRPETAQGIFIHFKNVVDTTRVKIPFGIGNIGKSFRNEVTPRNFTFRSREFEQMEIEFFCHPDDADTWYTFWRDERMRWWESIGLAGANLRLREHDRDELAHYAKEGAGTADVEYKYPFTAPDFGELEGVAHRTDFDLRQHAEHSGLGDKMKYFDTTRGELAKNGQPKGERYFPHCIEPAAGLDRGVLALICEAFTPDPDRPSKLFMRFHPRMAPVKAAVFPLVNKDGMPEKAKELRDALVKRFGHLGMIEFDAKQSIGKRYARMDEVGCPYCFTIDGDTLADGEHKDTVTMRDRDTAEQRRIPIADVPNFLAEKLGVG